MNKRQLIQLLQDLNLEQGQYAVFGSSCMTIRNLRDSDDLDLFVSNELYDQLAANGWQKIALGQGRPYLTTKLNGQVVEAIVDWGSNEGWQPNIKQYLRRPEIINGISFTPLKDIYEWKRATRRPKDIPDLALIENYWQGNQT